MTGDGGPVLGLPTEFDRTQDLHTFPVQVVLQLSIVEFIVPRKLVFHSAVEGCEGTSTRWWGLQ